ncbi:cell wall hydrolase [Brevundimonas sp. VNH65]|uniref:cell wall hydrolase n=1 Tax=Brevundimonas sp. VNH65 TaxID=3400917 RepID=UPI003C0A9A5A
MRVALPVIAAGGIAVAAAAAVLTPLAWADPAPRAAPTVSPIAARSAAPTDAERRAELDRRLQAMVKDGRFRRLSDARPRPVAAATRDRAAPRPAARPRSRQATPPAAAGPAAGPTVAGLTWGGEAAPRFAPPPQRTSGFNLGSLTRPRLDLKTPPVVPNNPVECLTQAIYYEARSESEEGQAAVAAVVMNRSRSGRYPRDVCQVVYQRNSRTCQFTFTCDGSIGRGRVNMTAWARAERIAREVYEGRSSVSLPGSSVNYHAHYVRPTWGQRLEQVRRIGAHIFYGAPKPGHRNPGADETPVETPKSGGLVFVNLDGEPIPAR